MRILRRFLARVKNFAMGQRSREFEVSRFSCMKLPGVSGVYDYAGPRRNLRYRSRPYCLPPMQKRRRPDCIFSELNTQPTCTPVYASPYTSRCATQNSGPSGSLLLSRRTLSFPASCRFIPAHRIGDLSPTEAGIRAVEQIMGVECPVWPFLVNLPA
jgi:hypothetical protein